MSKTRIRKKLKKHSDRPILMVNKTNKHLYAQLIDHQTGKVIAASSDFDFSNKSTSSKKQSEKISIAQKIGQKIAEVAKKEKVKEIVFDRSGYPYQGIIKDIAEGARSGGLKF
jgi:large subunit ribosomal protein L18